MSSCYLTRKPWGGADIPDWFDPEDEGNCIRASLGSVTEAVESIPEDAVFEVVERYSVGFREDLGE